LNDTDLAIVGSGFGGSILAMIARQRGYRVLLLERGRHPRFAIGESASPLAGVIIEQLADRYDLPRLRPLSAFGTWQREYPDVVCGLKRGFTYFKHETGRSYRTASDRSNQLLVAASPNDELSDTHWLRSDVDHFLVQEAIGLGVEYLDELTLDALEWHADHSATLTGTRHGATVRVRATFVVDASGPRGFLSRSLGIDEVGFGDYPKTQALYSHFVDVARCDQMPDFATDGTPPYPIDDAALHHVFDGGWMWVLRFGNGITSAGIVVTHSVANQLRLADGEPAWQRFLARHPSIAAQFASAKPIREFTWMPRVSYRAAHAAGDGWAMLPSAAAFIDPLFSTGIPLTLLGIERLAVRLPPSRDALRRPGKPDTTPTVRLKPDTTSYDETTLGEADHTASFIAGCYAAFPRFDAFTSYSMFYFAAASFSEMRRRLNPERASGGFLRAADAAYASSLRALSPLVCAPGADYLDRIAQAVAPINVAGLCNPELRNWYPVDLEDTIRGAHKLELTPEYVRAALEFANASTPHVPGNRRDPVDARSGTPVSGPPSPAGFGAAS
jgi:tetracycline 7-halogenase / FADH2 O2-dependent halogenase